MTTLVLPEWLDQVRGVDFTPEKELLSDLERWATGNGWEVSDGSSLPSELSRRTDVLLSQPGAERHLTIEVLQKTRRGPSIIRVDAGGNRPFTHRVFELVYQPKHMRWRLETGTVPLSDDIQKEGWDRLVDFAFRP